MKLLAGKRALVTGASGGLGGAIARALHGQGAIVKYEVKLAFGQGEEQRHAEAVASPPDLVASYPKAKNQDQAQYFANVTNMDLAVGRLLATLDQLGVADNTLVFFTSDNGPDSAKELFLQSSKPLPSPRGSQKASHQAIDQLSRKVP